MYYVLRKEALVDMFTLYIVDCNLRVCKAHAVPFKM